MGEKDMDRLLSDLGESGIVDHLRHRFQSPSDTTLVGIGDDCAVLELSEDRVAVVTTDMMVEDVHFLLSEISPRELGEKLLCVNASDIAAMGGRPVYGVLSLALPAQLSVGWLDEFIRGVEALAAESGFTIVGGDTNRSLGPVVLNLTLWGEAQRQKLKLRSHAQPGDRICVTGNVGDSAAGLQILLKGQPQGDLEKRLVKQHHRPRAHLKEGLWLGAQGGVRAMMDVSDGLATDLKRLCVSSSCGALVELELLPLSEDLRLFAKHEGVDGPRLGFAGGEDYCLLLTVAAEEMASIGEEYRRVFGSELVAIGDITNQKGLVQVLQGGKPLEAGAAGFRHFS